MVVIYTLLILRLLLGKRRLLLDKFLLVRIFIEIFVFIISDRYGHTSSIIRQNIIFFGGWEFGKALNDINILLSK